MARVFAVHAGSRGTYPNNFSDPIDQDIHTQCAVGWKIVVSEWQLVIAVSLNIRLRKPAKLYMCTQTHYVHDEDGHMVLGVCGHGSELLSHSGNVVTIIGLHKQLKQFSLSFQRKHIGTCNYHCLEKQQSIIIGIDDGRCSLFKAKLFREGEKVE